MENNDTVDGNTPKSEIGSDVVEQARHAGPFRQEVKIVPGATDTQRDNISLSILARRSNEERFLIGVAALVLIFFGCILHSLSESVSDSIKHRADLTVMIVKSDIEARRLALDAQLSAIASASVEKKTTKPEKFKSQPEDLKKSAIPPFFDWHILIFCSTLVLAMAFVTLRVASLVFQRPLPFKDPEKDSGGVQDLQISVVVDLLKEIKAIFEKITGSSK